MEKIEAVTKLKEGESYTLEDKDYLLIKAIQELTTQIRRLADK